MFEELYAKIPDVDAYLARIGMTRAEISLDTKGLGAIVRAHLGHIPFDDIDVWGAGMCPSLAIEDLYNKVIVRRRGGYCFELNSLFQALLRDLGFDSYLVLVYCVANRDYLPVAAHCAVIAVIDGEKYFMDVGYGGNVPYGILKMDGEEHLGFIIRDEGEFTALYRLEGGERVRAMIFRDIRTPNVDFISQNYYVSQNPTSTFRSRLSLNIRTPQGIYIVDNNTFKISRGEDKQTRELNGIDDLRSVMCEYYGMNPDEAPLRESL